MLLEVLGLLLLTGVALVSYVRWSQNHWRRRGVPTLASTFLLGSLAPALRKHKTFATVLRDVYVEAQSRGLQFGGMYTSTRATLLLVEPALVRLVTISHFDHFVNRQAMAKKSGDELLSRSLLNLQGDEWRHMRHQLSPAFTGSKLRSMVPLMSEAARSFVRFLTTRPSEPLEVRNAYRRLATDVIATTAFGTVSDAVNDPSSEFYANGMKLLEFKGGRWLKLIGFLLAPRLMQRLGVKFLPEELDSFFQNIIRTNIGFRERENMSRPDMIQLLLDARRNRLTEGQRGGSVSESEMYEHDSALNSSGTDFEEQGLTDLDIVSQAFTFFLAGFETVSTTLSYASAALAQHPELQERLAAEVDTAFERVGGAPLSFEAVHGLKYMDMFISEVLRMFPIMPYTDRVCTKTLYSAEHNLYVKQGDVVGIPLYAFHHDPKFFPEPDRFDPERFSEINKHSIRPFTYMPFGLGPRNCIGIRFALLEVKLLLAHVVASCRVEPCEGGTHFPITPDPKRLDNVPLGGFLLTLTPREHPSVRCANPR